MFHQTHRDSRVHVHVLYGFVYNVKEVQSNSPAVDHHSAEIQWFQTWRGARQHGFQFTYCP